MGSGLPSISNRNPNDPMNITIHTSQKHSHHPPLYPQEILCDEVTILPFDSDLDSDIYVNQINNTSVNFDIQQRMDKVSRLFHNNSIMSDSIRHSFAQLMLSNRLGGKTDFRMGPVFNHYDTKKNNKKKVDIQPIISDTIFQSQSKSVLPAHRSTLNENDRDHQSRRLLDHFPTKELYDRHTRYYKVQSSLRKSAAVSPEIENINMSKRYRE